MAKVPFVTKEQLDEIVKKYPTPFHLYDEKGIRETARGLYKAFSWNKGFKEYFKEIDADIFCIQETKMQEAQLDENIL